MNENNALYKSLQRVVSDVQHCTVMSLEKTMHEIAVACCSSNFQGPWMDGKPIAEINKQVRGNHPCNAMHDSRPGNIDGGVAFIQWA